MGNVLQELIVLLQLEKLEENLFRGQSQDLGFGHVFGGQVLGQALSAASQTVPADRKVHSLHAYFVRPGDAQKPIIYSVDCIRDGKGFTTRSVKAIQKGRTICLVSASFQIDEKGYEHQAFELPNVEGPDGLLSDLDRLNMFRDRIPELNRKKLMCDKPIEIRPVNPIDPNMLQEYPPFKYQWIRASGTLPDNFDIHTYLLAYASDFGLLGTSLYPHRRTYWDSTMRVATIDHTIWFHRTFRMDEWLLHSMDSPSASGARGFTRGMIFTRDGRLIASIAQEGLIRDLTS